MNLRHNSRMHALLIPLMLTSLPIRSINAFTTSKLNSFIRHTHPRFPPPSTSRFTSKASSSPTTMSSSSSNILTNKILVSVEECLTAKKHESESYRVIFVDGSWHLVERDGRAEYEAGPRIKDARYFDINDIASKGDLNPKGLPHMMPPKKLFAAAMDALDIQNSDHVVIYAAEGCAFTARPWYTFRAMGHDARKVHLLQGSLPEWEEKGGEVDTNPVTAIRADDLDLNRETRYRATNAANIYGMDDVLKVLGGKSDDDAVIIDTRGAARFRGEAPEPREGLRLGHMPGAVNVPFLELLRSDDVTKYKDVEDMKRIFREAGVDVDSDKNIVCSCGSGVTACAIALALEECGRDPEKTFLYDGSWAEWGADPDTPMVS